MRPGPGTYMAVKFVSLAGQMTLRQICVLGTENTKVTKGISTDMTRNLVKLRSHKKHHEAGTIHLSGTTV